MLIVYRPNENVKLYNFICKNPKKSHSIIKTNNEEKKNNIFRSFVYFEKLSKIRNVLLHLKVNFVLVPLAV